MGRGVSIQTQTITKPSKGRPRAGAPRRSRFLGGFWVKGFEPPAFTETTGAAGVCEGEEAGPRTAVRVCVRVRVEGRRCRPGWSFFLCDSQPRPPRLLGRNDDALWAGAGFRACGGAAGRESRRLLSPERNGGPLVQRPPVLPGEREVAVGRGEGMCVRVPGNHETNASIVMPAAASARACGREREEDSSFTTRVGGCARCNPRFRVFVVTSSPARPGEPRLTAPRHGNHAKRPSSTLILCPFQTSPRVDNDV